MSELTNKQQRFIREYLVDLNGTAAAKRAGYSARSAYSIAHELIRKPAIAAAIARALAHEAEITRTRVVDEIAAIAFANAGDYFHWGPDGITLKDSKGLTDEQRAVIAEASQTRNAQGGGSIRIKLHDKLSALARLARITGLDGARAEVAGPGGDAIPVADACSELELAKRVALLLAKGLAGERRDEAAKQDDGPERQQPATPDNPDR